MAITAIKRLVNRSAFPFRVVNRENTGTRGSGRIVSGGLSIDSDMWIPWCASSEDFACNHYIIVEVSATPTVPLYLAQVYWLWQAGHNDGDFVRVSTSGRYEDPGDRIAGDSTVGGNRKLIFTDNSIALEQDS